MRFSKIEVICRVSGPRVRTKVEPDPDLFTYRGLNKDPDPVFNGSEPPGNRIIGYPFTSLVLRFMDGRSPGGNLAGSRLWFPRLIAR